MRLHPSITNCFKLLTACLLILADVGCHAKIAVSSISGRAVEGGLQQGARQAAGLQNLQISGTVWSPAPKPGSASLDSTALAPQARLEFLSLPATPGPLVLLATGETDGAGHYDVPIKGVPSQSTILVVAYLNSLSIGEHLLPIATFLGLAASDGTIRISCDINKASSIVSSLLIAHAINLATVTNKQTQLLTNAVTAAVLAMGPDAKLLSPAEIVSALAAQKSFNTTMDDIFNTPLPPRDAASVAAMDFAVPRQPENDILPPSGSLVNAAAPVVSIGTAPAILSPALLTATDLVFSGTGVLAPTSGITVQLSQAPLSGTESPVCLDPGITAIASPCPQLVTAPLSADGSWKLTVPSTLLVDGRTYTLTVSAIVDPAHPDVIVAQRVLTFLWINTNPKASLVSGTPADPSSTTNVSAIVGGAGVVSYSYALLSGAPSCADATYSSWTPVVTPLVTTAGVDGAKLLCLLGRDAGMNVQAVPTAITWTQHLPGGVVTDVTPPVPGGAGVISSSGATATDLNLSWTAGTDDISLPANLVYSVYQSDTNNINTIANAKLNGTLIQAYTANISSFTVTGLSVGTTYYFNILIKDQAGNETSYTSLAAATVPGAFSLTGPPNPGNLGMPDVTWGAAAGASTYDLVVSGVSGCGTPLQTYASVVGTTQTLSALADGTYYTCITAKNVDGDTTAATNSNRSFVIDTLPPGAFSITGPTSPTVVTAPTVTWGTSTGATNYDLKVATASGCAAPIQSYLNLATTSQTLTVLGAGTYYICITAKDAATNATLATNTNYSLVIQTTLGAFSITGPATPTDNGTPTVTWSTSSAATSYDVTISTASDCSVVTQSYTGVVGTSQPLTTLPDGTYYACITAQSSGPSQTATNTFYQFVVPPIVCDTGNLRTTCVINTLHWVADGKTITGPGSLDVQNGGTIRSGNPTLYYDNFAGGLSANWTVTSGTWTVAGGILSQTSTATAPDGGNKRIFLNDKAYPDDYTIVAEVRNDTWVVGPYPRVGVDVHVDPLAGAGNSLLYTNNGSGLVTWLDDTRFSGSNAFTMTTGTWYWFKLDVSGSQSTMQGKVWQFGSAEPTAFPSETTMPGRNHGNPGLFGGSAAAGSGSNTASFKEVTVSTTKAWGQIAIQMTGNVTVESGGAIEGSLSILSANNLTINTGGNITAGKSAAAPGTTGEIKTLAVTNLIDVAGTLWANLPNVTAANFQIDAGGIVKADGKGFLGRFYSDGLGSGAGIWANAGAGGGGGHGGAGGTGGAGGGAGGATYDSSAAPVLWGSSGGGANGAAGGDGGGVIKITTAGGTITVNGTLAADGLDGLDGTSYNTGGGSANGAGGGAGGSVWVNASTLTGTGFIYARGGAGGTCYSNTSAGGGGGGGMIKKSVTTNTFTGTIAATGGNGGSCPAGTAGTAGSSGTNL